MPTRRQNLTALAGGLTVGTIARADDIHRYKNRSSLRFLTAPEQFVQPEKTKHTPDLRYFIRHFIQRTDAAYGLMMLSPMLKPSSGPKRGTVQISQTLSQVGSSIVETQTFNCSSSDQQQRSHRHMSPSSTKITCTTPRGTTDRSTSMWTTPRSTASGSSGSRRRRRLVITEDLRSSERPRGLSVDSRSNCVVQ